MLHIHNGDSLAATARQANIPGEHLAWREALVCGPAPGNLSQEEFLNVRATHLSEAYGVDFGKCRAELRAQHETLAGFRHHEEIVLWFEHDLFCQVQLIYLLDWFARHELENTKLTRVSIDQFEGIENFRGLGQLNQEQLASLFPLRREMSPEQLRIGSRAWRAYTAPTEVEIAAVLEADTASLPFLQAALNKHLQRFPSVQNGLGRVASVLLELIANGQREFKGLFAAFGRREPLYGFGDAQVFLELKQLSSANHPVITITNGNENPLDTHGLLNSSFEVTNLGGAVLNGEKNFMELNGIDTWLGGVHLTRDPGENQAA
jgi:hypothetical protein